MSTTLQGETHPLQAGNAINKTIVTTYEDAKVMMDYINGFCPCCKYDHFEKWYGRNNEFFITTGMFVMEGLLKDDNSGYLKYCFSFDFSDKERAIFIIYNYYTREKVCKFYYNRKDNPDFEHQNVELDYYDKRRWRELRGDFMNSVIVEKTGNIWATLERRQRGKKGTAQTRIWKDVRDEVDYEIRKFMCEHTVLFCYSTMFYFSREAPSEIDNPYIAEHAAAEDKEMVQGNVTYKYKYTGYIDLTKTKVYRAKKSERLEEEKREYERHIEKWSVRGHYRNINGERRWIAEHEKGSGTLEKRLYGTIPERELNLIPKIFEVERKVTVGVSAEIVPEYIDLTGEELFASKSVIDKKEESKEDSPAPIAEKAGFIRSIINAVMRMFKYLKI